MGLKPTDTPGYWEDDDWDGKAPATFALLIGVSKYRHLRDGNNEAAPTEPWIREASALGQLFVSAMTARRMLDWLASDYRMTSAPIARCWLLTAPTEDELADVPELAENALEPTLENCRGAIEAWSVATRQLPKQAQENSRSIFFFSGHGIETTSKNQLLLPSDYLKGPVVRFNHAISTRNIRIGMESVPVGHRYYFWDACRNDTDKIRQKRPEGTEILPEQPSNMSYGHIALDAALSATAASTKAWQPKKPEDGETLFGQALITGLQGAPSISVTQDDGYDTIRYSNLYRYVHDKVPDLIKKFGSNATQKVKPSMEHGIDGIVTELDPESTSRPLDLPSLVEKGSRSDPPDAPFDPIPMSATDAGDKWVEGGETASAKSSTFVTLSDSKEQAAGWAHDFNIGHQLFGHETVTALFSGSMRVAALGRGEWLRPEELRVIKVTRSESSTDGTGFRGTYYLQLVIEAGDLTGHWLELRNLGAEGGGGVVLPFDPSRPSAFELEVVLDHGPSAVVVESLDALPWDEDAESPVSLAAELWRKYQLADLTGAVRRLEDADLLRSLVQGKLVSPLAATIAASVLLRANRVDLLSDWLRNLASWFPHLSDGAVLWAEQRWRESRGQDVVEIGQSMATASERGLPMTAEAMGYAQQLYHRLGREADALPADLLDQLVRGKTELDQALRFFRPGGLFSGYFGYGPDNRPVHPNERLGQNATEMTTGPADSSATPEGVFVGTMFLPLTD